VIPPIITALTSAKDLDVASQEAVCAKQLAAGVQGVFVAGTTGEGAFLPPALLQQLVEVVVKQVAGQVPVLAGALAPGTDQAVAAARLAAKAGADGLVVTAPYYMTASAAETERHISTVAKAIDLPVLAYSIPPMTHQAMPLSVVEGLFADGSVVGLKDSGHDLWSLLQAIDLGKRYGKVVFSGYEPFAVEALKRGGAGVVASISNVDVAGFPAVWKAAQAGNWDEAERIHANIIKLLSGFDQFATAQVGPTSGLIAGIKAACQALGLTAGRAVLGPLTELPDDVAAAVRVHLQANGLL
jgi:4-hydroxy-tetrahydrodipicolinate synthase